MGALLLLGKHEDGGVQDHALALKHKLLGDLVIVLLLILLLVLRAGGGGGRRGRRQGGAGGRW